MFINGKINNNRQNASVPLSKKTPQARSASYIVAQEEFYLRPWLLAWISVHSCLPDLCSSSSLYISHAENLMQPTLTNWPWCFSCFASPSAASNCSAKPHQSLARQSVCESQYPYNGEEMAGNLVDPHCKNTSSLRPWYTRLQLRHIWTTGGRPRQSTQEHSWLTAWDYPRDAQFLANWSSVVYVCLESASEEK